MKAFVSAPWLRIFLCDAAQKPKYGEKELAVLRS